MKLTQDKFCSRMVDPNHRNGITVFEALISMILVSATVAISLPTLRVVNLQRKSAHDRQTATTGLANLAERISVENSWNSLTSEKLAQYETDLLSDLNLKESRITINLIEDKANNPGVRQVQIQLTWQDPYGETVDPLFLSLWFYQGGKTNE